MLRTAHAVPGRRSSAADCRPLRGLVERHRCALARRGRGGHYQVGHGVGNRIRRFRDKGGFGRREQSGLLQLRVLPATALPIGGPDRVIAVGFQTALSQDCVAPDLEEENEGENNFA